MYRSLFICFSLALLMILPAGAQITITSDDLPCDAGTTVSHEAIYEDFTISGGPSGANQTWDFSAIVTTEPWSENWIDYASSPYAASYPDANRCVVYSEIVDQYHYYQLTQSDHLFRGIGSSLAETHVTILREPNNYPMNYGDEWWGVVEMDYGMPGMSQQDTTWGHVDGWGTLIDVTGSHQCLRLQLHIVSWILVMGVPTNMMEMYRYIYYTADGAAGCVVSGATADPNFTEGHFDRVLGITGVQELPVQGFLPTDVSLQPAFPNPFNPETNLNFSVPVAGDVRLQIFDAQGRMVTELQNGWLNRGSYQAQFKADDLSSGTYIARLTSGNVQQTQPLILVK